MPHYSVKLATYDPAIIDAFDRLRKNRKQAAFTHEALKHYLSTEKGLQVLVLMEQKAPNLSAARIVLPYEDVGEASANQTIDTNDLLTATSINSSSVLNSILE